MFLSEHFRCHTDIIEYCNDLLYDGLLVPSRPLKGYKFEGKTPGAFLFQLVENSQDRRNGSSRVNSQEAEAITNWIIGNFEYFHAIYNPDADAAKDKSLFAVVTPFAAQAREVRKTLRMKSEDLASKVTIGTAHTLQGAERQVVLFSPVYGDNSDKASFVDGTLELMNVAVSCAKDLFIVFCGQRRWEDTGPVFGLVRQRAVIGSHWFGYGRSQGLAFEAPVSLRRRGRRNPHPCTCACTCTHAGAASTMGPAG
ncbi:DEAD/DEAH box helicase [Rothia nasimurium]|uniref:DEAD/DEAH box helicase n=1 Tax=Rothia nasimurium TaxID=85336 RepID=UPI001F18F4CE